MCKLIEDMANERAERAAEKSKIQTAINLLALGTVSKEDIAKVTGLDIEQINELAAQTVSALA